MSRVVVVEDDVWLAEHFVRTLADAGYDAQFSTNAIHAIDMIDNLKPDVIVLDMLLTVTTGMVLLHELQSYGDMATIPVVVCTNSAEEFDAKLLEPYGVRRVLDKTTMRPDDLIAAVRKVLL